MEDTSDTEPDEFVQQVTNPWRWFVEAEGLLVNSDVLWNRAFKKLGELAEADKASNKHNRLSWRAAALMKSTLLLSGLSVENALKGHLIAKRPGDVEFISKMDGTGEMTEVEFKKIGDTTIDHSLETLAHESDLLNLEKNPAVQDTENLSDYKKSLRFLEEIVIWHGRYPSPLDYSDHKELNEEILPDNNELDFYAEAHAAANDTVLFLLPPAIEEEIREQGVTPMTEAYE